MQCPVPLIFQAREIAGGVTKENLYDGETDLVAVRGKSDFHVY